MNEKEKIYKTMTSVGGTGIVLGILVLMTSLVAGVLMIVNGARLLGRRSKVLI